MYKGFTLLELMIVLALLMGIAGLSSYFLVFTDTMAVRREVDRLYAVLLYMQRKALLERRQLVLVFDPKRSSYTADHEHVLDHAVLFSYKEGVRGPPSHPIDTVKVAITWPSNRVTFFPDGTIAAGACYLTDRHRSCQYALTCDASEVTHIRRYRYDGKWILV